MRWFAILAVTAGCGRIGFRDAPDAAPDMAVMAAAIDAPVDSDAIAPCPPSYATVYGESRYRIAQGDSWVNAEHACEADGRGMHLVVFEDSPEMNAIENLAAGTTIWVGLSDRISDGTFLDVMGPLPPFFPAWQGDENSLTGPGCVEFEPTSRTIHDVACSTSVVYVCECDGVPAQPSSY